jgi:hypothetical protein
MIVGIIPGPKEPKKIINSYLTPLVLELKEAWSHGFNVLAAHNVPVYKTGINMCDMRYTC